MNYDEFTPLEATVTIVFGGTAGERDAFQAALLKKYPAFQTGMHPCLENYKKPLLGGHKPIVDYLVKQAKTGERGLTAQQLKHIITDSAKRLRIDHVLDRHVPAFSSRQKYLFSLILEECSQVSRKILVRDDHPRLDEGDCVGIANWFLKSCGSDGHMVILAELPTETMQDYCRLAGSAAFYQMEQDKLTPFDISAAYLAKRLKEDLLAQTRSEAFEKGLAAYQEKNYAEALHLFEKAAELGDPDAQFNCGVMYDNGQGAPVDKAKAFDWFRKAAEQGFAKAQYNCGAMCFTGEGTQVDKAKALYWYKEAAKQGHPDAQFQYGLMQEDGDGTQADKVKALYWYKKAAEQGHKKAQFHCGEMYYRGAGTSVNKFRALDWYEKSARQGYLPAMALVAGMYRSGDGTAVNKATALALYETMARVGVQSAQYICGEMYYRGEGTARNLSKAKMWWQKAAEQGNTDAKNMLKNYFPKALC